MNTDFYDGCMNDPDTGWAGFMDHRVGQHFNSEEEQREYYRVHGINDEDDDDEY